MQDLLQRGVAAARAGRREEARALLLQVVEADEQSELGWLWLSGVLDDPEDIRVALENVLALNPDSPQARQGLEWLATRTGKPSAPAAEPEPAEPEPPAPEPAQRVEPPAATPAPAAPRATIDAPEPEAPCPYCGAPTNLGQRSCLRCRRSLMVRDAPRPQRSLWLTILAWLRLAEAALTAIAGLVIVAVAVLIWQTPARGQDADAPFTVATIGVITLIFAGVHLSIGRALLRRARWAYYVTIALATLGALGLLLRIVAASLLPSLTERLGQQRELLQAIETVSAISLIITIVLTLLYFGLVALSYGDFFGPLRRFQIAFRKADPAGHYNNGVAYKDRGMWYMAMREWELAVNRAPFDLNYLHALGLAYAQVGRFDRARSTLERALEIAPGHRQISESRALVDQMASKRQ